MESPLVYILDNFYPAVAHLEHSMAECPWEVQTFTSPEFFLQRFDPSRRGCIVLDYLMPSMTGIEVIQHVRGMNCPIPFIVATGYGNISCTVQFMRLGAQDILEKPYNMDRMLSLIRSAVEGDIQYRERRVRSLVILNRLCNLTERERQVMNQVMDGRRSKEIANILGLSPKTIEYYRSSILAKLDVASIEVAGIQLLQDGIDVFTCNAVSGKTGFG